MGISLQMIEVAIGWEVYALHRSALDLGWIGLAEFIPMFVLALPAGHLADRLARRSASASRRSPGPGRRRYCRTWRWPSAPESRWPWARRRRGRWRRPWSAR